MMSIIVFFILAALVLAFPELMLKAIAAIGVMFVVMVFLFCAVVLHGVA